jgi:hypothetical protein
MACFCGACGNQISSAVENGGSFQSELTPPISDTCETCEKKLKAVVTKAVLDIREQVKLNAEFFAARLARLKEMGKKS